MRLPPFIEQLTPIAQTLAALQTEQSAQEADIARRNAQVVVETAEEGLSLWEADYALPSTGTDAVRRRRIWNALRGRRTLTADFLRELAEEYGADWGEVTEDFANGSVRLEAVFDNRVQTDLSTLIALLERLCPAHLDVQVLAKELWQKMPVRHKAPITAPTQAGWDGGCYAGARYAIYAGGMDPVTGSMFSVVNGYDKDCTRFNPGNLEIGRFIMGSARAGEYVLFAGGCSSSNYSSNFQSKADGYGEHLTHVHVDSLLSGRGWPMGESVGTGAVFAGGYKTSYMTTAESYDADLTWGVITALAQARREHKSCRTEHYALFAGGVPSYGNKTATVEAYDADFTRHAAESMSIARSHLSSARVGQYALFAGGYISVTGITDRVDAYDDTLTRTAAPALHTALLTPGGGTLGQYALFVGGWDTVNNLTTVNIYDEALCRTMGEEVSVPNSGYLSATVEDIAFFCVPSYPLAEAFRLKENKPET